MGHRCVDYLHLRCRGVCHSHSQRWQWLQADPSRTGGGQRHSLGRENGDAHGHSQGHADSATAADGYAHGHGHGHAYSIGAANGDTYADPDADGRACLDAHTHGDAHADTDAICSGGGG